MSDTIFVGNLTKRDGKFGEYFTGSIKLDEIKKHDSGKGYAKIKVQLRKEPGKFGETHSITIDTWKPEQKQGVITSIPQRDSKVSIDEIPF